MINNKLLPKLSQNLLEILNDDEYYDITIEVGNDPYVKVFRAHMVILNYRSPYLRRILSTNKKKNDESLTHIKLPYISPDAFQIVLRYIYGGRLSLEEYDPPDIIEILVTANQLSLQELIPYLESFLIENQTNWMEQNFDLIYRTSFENDSFLGLQDYCMDLISKESNKIFNLPSFSSIPEKLLILLIQNDDLQISEIQVWEYVLKWGLAQNSELPFDSTDFSKDDFNALKNTLQRCIPFIRFHNLSSKEFLKKVLPYKKILPKELYKDLLEYFLDNDDKSSEPRIIKSKIIDSRIITFQHAELISKWIDRLEIEDKLTTSYEFKLLFYYDSHDEFNIEKFRAICKNKSRTVIIINTKESDEILGGYNPIKWKFNRSYGTTKDSFIFSFSNNDDTENYILSRVNYEERAINNHSIILSFGGRDLMIYQYNGKLKTVCEKESYENLIGDIDDIYTINELEIFQIHEVDI
ncbi:hypothetical protein C1645_834419 [Glomus cerebriforme]|uniref:Kelch-like protein 17 n=1 Tax=Glomus cerebriforme TaxID=658196 RepID=A0A397SFM4_9GLOM|nr:hypothetical protein C1645_834419 [Glomus cerebriforme]